MEGRWHLLRLCLLAFGLLPLSCLSAGLDVTTAERLAATPALTWCRSAPELGLADIQTGACHLEAMAPADLAQGFSRDAFWLRLPLANPSAQPVERWLTVGHPRLERVSLFVEPAPGPIQEVGIATPLAQRHETGRRHNALRLVLAPGSSQVVWLRIASRTAVDLTVTLWQPSRLEDFEHQATFSQALALGGLLLAMVFAGLIFAVYRERQFLFFSAAMLGEIGIEAFRSGLLQSYFWPADLPLPVEFAAVGALLAFGAFIAFIHAFLPEIRQHRALYRLFMAATAITLAAQLWAILADYAGATPVWAVCLNASIVLGLALIVLRWRCGNRSAGTLLLSFGFLAGLELLRLASSLGLLPFLSAEKLAGPWALVMTTPLVLMSIFQRSHELQEKLARAQAEELAKVHFLAQMSHELRAPLDTILGNAQLLSLPGNQSLLDEGLASVRQSAGHLLAMVDEILDHARGLAGKLVMSAEPVHWPRFLQAVAQNGHLLAVGNGNSFVMQRTGPLPPAVMVDRGRLRQVLDNLLSNACRHTQAGTVTLSCSATPLPTGRIRLDFAVADTGEGVAPDDAARIFRPFERGRLSRRNGGKGIGMGLAIFRQLVEALGGQLDLDTQAGPGACFRFFIEVAAADQVPENQLDEAGVLPTGYLGRRRQLLLVDDDDASNRLLCRLLTPLGFGVTTATSGNDAAPRIAAETFDLVLTDQFMADGDGWQVLQTVAQLQPLLPVLLLSAAPPRRPDGFSKHLAFAGCLLRPLDHASLLGQIGQLLHLEWQMAPAVAAAPDITPTLPASLTPAEWAEVRALVDNGAVSDLMDWADALKARRPDLAEYALALHTAARLLDFPALHTLTTEPK